ncbi:GTP 3',8-cyclase MoaA [Rickettsiales bacterium]|nr:GTP 3',8-cyclase MoaA [Rickettsiales bacterium]
MLDSFGRKIDYMRFSITDRCDLRCRYCMPKNMVFSDKRDLLDLKDLKNLSQSLVEIGIKKIRITGGEPLVRKDLIPFIEYLNSFLKKNILKEVTITTNGTLLEKYAKKLRENGIKRINVSVDSIIPEKYEFITNGGKLEKVISGIIKARDLGINIKINTVLIKNFNIDEIISISNWCSKLSMNLSFIEIMPIGDMEYSRKDQYFPITSVKEIIRNNLGLKPIDLKTNGPSNYFETEKLKSIIGFISPISNHFCESCNRIRITSNGILYSCLGHEDSLDLKPFLKKESPEALTESIKKSYI